MINQRYMCIVFFVSRTKCGSADSSRAVVSPVSILGSNVESTRSWKHTKQCLRFLTPPFALLAPRADPFLALSLSSSVLPPFGRTKSRYSTNSVQTPWTLAPRVPGTRHGQVYMLFPSLNNSRDSGDFSLAKPTRRGWSHVSVNDFSQSP